MKDSPEGQDLKEWLSRKALASKILMQQRKHELRVMNAQQSFAEFIDLWRFYSSSPSAQDGQAELTQAQLRRDSKHRARMAGLFRQLAKNGR